MHHFLSSCQRNAVKTFLYSESPYSTDLTAWPCENEIIFHVGCLVIGVEQLVSVALICA